MVEEGSGKGIQYASGTTTQLKSYLLFNGNDEGYTLRYDKLPFTPTIMFIDLGDVYDVSSYSGIGGDSSDYYAVKKNLLGNNIILFSENDDITITLGNGVIGLRITNITDSSCYIEPTDKDGSISSARYFEGPFTYYAIGVGEEDTTLRDSLASILQEEGVSVTEEDDMASLISKVDEEFNDKNNEMSSLNTNITLLTNQVNSLTNELAGKVTPTGTAVASNVLSGKTFINSTGQTITGTMANRGAKTFTPSASKQTGAAGYYSSITVNTDSNLVAANIVSGKKIFGVTGTAPSCFTTTPNYALKYSSSSGANGIYTVTHNLGRVPTDVIVYMTEIKGGSYNFHTATLDYPSYNVNNKKSFEDYNDDGLDAWIANLTTTTIDIQIKSVGYTNASATIAKVIII
jgi:hypothetical protein